MWDEKFKQDAVALLMTFKDDHPSLEAAAASLADKIGCSAHQLLAWAGPQDAANPVDDMARELAELKAVNALLRTAAAGEDAQSAPAAPVQTAPAQTAPRQVEAGHATPAPAPQKEFTPGAIPALREGEGLVLGAEPMEQRPIDPSLPTVAALWIGGSLSFLEQVCLKSFRDHGHRTVLYSYDDVSGAPVGVELRDASALYNRSDYITHKASGSPAPHADIFRLHMIAETGFIWIDADMLCMRPWRFDTPYVVGWEKPGKVVCNAVMGFPPESQTLQKMIAFCADEYPIPPWLSDEGKAELQAAHDAGTPTHVTELPWGVWGPSAITHFLKETGEAKYALPQNAFYPISFADRRLLLRGNVRPVHQQMGPDCYGVHLWNRRIRRRIVTHEDGIPNPGSLIGRALTRHNIDPRLAPIPDVPPPGFPTQDELRARAASEPKKNA